MDEPDLDEFYPKFRVIRRSTDQEIDPSTCFTLIPAHDPSALVALRAYADSVEAVMPGLARDIRKKLIEPNE